MIRHDSEQWVKNTLNKIDTFEKRVRTEIYDRLDLYLANLVHGIERCESPIEQLMLIALNESLDFMMERTGFPISCAPQVEIETNRGKYRVDFLIDVWVNPPDGFKYIVVECDGHEFHEKTKEQAQRDKSRDRDLLANGYAVLRFTGSEIWRDPRRCVYEVERAIKTICRTDD